MKKLLVAVASLGALLLSGLPASSAPGPLRYTATNLAMYEAEVSLEVAALLRQSGFDVVSQEGAAGDLVHVEMVLAPGDVERVRSLGADVRAMPRPAAAASFAQAGSVWQPYLGPGGLKEEVEALAAAYPSLTKVVTIGQSYLGTDIIAVKVSKNASLEPDGRRPAVLYVSLQHAREWITGEMTTRLLNRVLSSYATDANMRRLVDSTELWFVPVANPDGYEFTFTEGNRLWRKTLRDNNGDGVVTTEDGVDPNRNFPTNWGMDDEGSSPLITSETYRGAGPASEPETQALDTLMGRIGFEFFINYHSFGPLILYPHGHQQQTSAADEPIFTALAGDDANPGVPGYDPDLGAELYITNGDTDEHAYRAHGTLPYVIEMNEGCDGCGFEFPDDEGLVQQEFEKNIAFALDLANSAARPDQPVSHLGNSVPNFVLDPFAVSYGNPQPVQVTVRRALGKVDMLWRVNGGTTRRVKDIGEWNGGERYGDYGDLYYARLRGLVTGTRPGDTVEVWFEGQRTGRPRSAAFTYTVASDTNASTLVVAAEDYTGLSPAQPGGPHYLSYYLDALAANGVTADVYDVDARGRRAPHPLGVLSHYDQVLWYTGDDVITRAPGQVVGTAAKLALDLELAMRDYINEGGDVAYIGQAAGLASGGDGLYWYNPFVPVQPECTTPGDYPCLPLLNDFLQYWLGAYAYNTGAGIGDDGAFPVVGNAGTPFQGAAYVLNGGDSADNQVRSASFLTTSSFLEPASFPSTAGLTYDRPSGAPYAPFTGEFYMASQQANISYKRLMRTIDMSGATSGSLSFMASFDTELDWDYVFVEAHSVDQDDWTTLPDLNGATDTSTGESCPEGWHDLHPFLANYQGADCSGTGDTGTWNAATGNSGGWHEWTVDLSAFAGRQVEVSISYVSDWSVQGLGVFIDDATVILDGSESSTADFEIDLGGWSVPVDPPEGSGANANSWIRSTTLFEEGAAVVTPHTVYVGFGLEGVDTAAGRNDLMARVLAALAD